MNYKQLIWDYFLPKLGPIGTAGLMGNMQNESGLIPYRLQGDFTSSYTKSLQYTSDVDSGVKSRTQFMKDGLGYGLVQLTFYTRKAAYYDYCKTKKCSIGDLNAQLEYIEQELNGYGLISKLKNAKTILEASNLILFNYERPLDQSAKVQQLRANLGQTIYNECINSQTIPQQVNNSTIKKKLILTHTSV
jgi:hypothetical protein